MKKKLYFLIFLLSSNLFASEKSIYDFKWLGDNETVYVIQNKEYIKAKSIAFDFSYAGSTNSLYYTSSLFSAALTYYISENWSVDFTYKMYTSSETQDLKNLLTSYSTQIKPLVRVVDYAKILHVNWIPFYGKVNTFNKIIFFDWGIGSGVGLFNTRGNYETFLITNKSITLKEEVDFGLDLRIFLKFYLPQKITFGFEYDLLGINTIKSSDAKRNFLFYTDFMISVGYLF